MGPDAPTAAIKVLSGSQAMSEQDLAHVAHIREAAGEGKRITFISGAFQVVHSGHIRLFNFGAECGDFLAVGLLPDETPTVVVPQDLRLEAVSSISLVDYAFVMDGPVTDILEALQPEFTVKGKEHETQENPEQPVVERYGGQLLFGSGEAQFSSRELLKSEIDHVRPGDLRRPTEYLNRHGFGVHDLRDVLARIKGLNVVIIGDLIIDDYTACEPVGMSQEDPTLVVTPITTERFLGGAGIVAAHAVGLGANARLFSVAGRDEACDFAQEKLSEYGVDFNLIQDTTRPTTLKTRYRAHGKTLLRVNHLRQHDISSELMAHVMRVTAPALEAADLVVFADFNYGCLPQPLVDAVCATCREGGIMMAADSQASSQYSDISRFKGMTLVTPTEREARLAVGDFSSGLVELGFKLQAAAQADNTLMTLGSEGALVQTKPNETDDGLLTDRLPAMNAAPRDQAGAGDSMLVTAAMSMAVGAPIWQAAYLGSVAAARQVARVGNIPLHASEILEHLGG